jgi:hypothetical protein
MGKRIRGRKRHVLVDTQGLLMLPMVHATTHFRAGLTMATLLGLFPFVLELYADSGYQGPKFQLGFRRVCRKVTVEIIERSNAGKFVVRPPLA